MLEAAEVVLTVAAPSSKCSFFTSDHHLFVHKTSSSCCILIFRFLICLFITCVYLPVTDVPFLLGFHTQNKLGCNTSGLCISLSKIRLRYEKINSQNRLHFEQYLWSFRLNASIVSSCNFLHHFLC